MLRNYIQENKDRNDLVYGNINNLEYLFAKGMIDLNIFEKVIKPYLQAQNNPTSILNELKVISTKEFDYLIGNGDILFFYQNKYYKYSLGKIPKRSISESIIDPINLIGSREGLNESIKDSRVLLKKRIKSNKLEFKEFIIGNHTLTDLNVVFINGKVNEKQLDLINKKIEKNLDKEIISIGDVTNLLWVDHLIPNFEITGNPETLANALLKGKIIILIDNLPLALIIPTSVLELTEIENETNNPKFVNIFNRLFILLFLFLSIFLLGLFVVVTSHHPQILPTIFIANFQLSERGTTFPLIIEIIVSLVLFELYRVISSRGSLSFVQNIIIVFGGIFIGQNAIDASIVGTFSIIITSISYISGFAVTTNPQLITSFFIFRIFILIMSFILGLSGFLISSLIIIDYLANIKVFDQLYFDSIIPWNLKKVLKWINPKKE